MTLFFLVTFCIWAIFWSFSSVLIERWKSWKWGILMWRSECPKCNHILSAWELIPIFSYIFQKWKCRNCKSSIPFFYPLLEISFWAIFSIVWWSIVYMGHPTTSFVFLSCLFYAWIVGIYIFYDIRFKEIPDEALIPAILLILSLFIFWYFHQDTILFFDQLTYDTFHTMVIDHLLWALILYLFFYLQILIPGTYFLLKKRSYSKIWDLTLLSVLLPFIAMKELFIKWFSKKWSSLWELDEEFIPTWVGWWDLRIALFTGLTLGMIHGVASFLIAYFLWAIYACFFLLFSAIKKKKIQSEVPFWPFLWVGWILAIFFHTEIIELFQRHLLF